MSELASQISNLWNTGDLSWLLYPHQQKLYKDFKKSDARKYVLHCSRRIGKSSVLLNIANEIGQTEKCIMRYGAATQKDVREMILPLMEILTRTAPMHLKPIWYEGKGKFIYPKTNSELVVSGLDEGRADNLRGTAMKIGFIDEAGFVDDLDYAIKSVLMPQLLTTNGRLVLASSSPLSPSHPFTALIEEAKVNKAYSKMTIHDDSRPDVLARIEEWQKEAGGAQSTTWRREYLCEVITDAESALVPEFNDAKAANIVTEWKRPPHFIPYTIMDLGYIDFTAIIFGYVDFLKAKFIVEDEILLNRKDSKAIADAIKAKEKELWGDSGRIKRVADGPLLTVTDFNSLHNLPFNGVAKDELEAQVNQLRLAVQSESLIIHPRCFHSVSHLKYGVWDKAHRKFDRSSAYGHFDCVAALMYFVRSADLGENPYPVNWGMSEFSHFITKPTNKDSDSESLETAFLGGFLK